jgi:hypothetical protein
MNAASSIPELPGRAAAPARQARHRRRLSAGSRQAAGLSSGRTRAESLTGTHDGRAPTGVSQSATSAAQVHRLSVALYRLGRGQDGQFTDVDVPGKSGNEGNGLCDVGATQALDVVEQAGHQGAGVGVGDVVG